MRDTKNLIFFESITEKMAEMFNHEPDGDLGLEWFVSNYYSFVVGFSGKGVISYSGLFGKGRTTYGNEFISEAVPSSIVDNIRRLHG